MERRVMVKGLLAALVGLLGARKAQAQVALDPPPPPQPRPPYIQVPRITKLSPDHARVSAMPGYRIEAVPGARAVARWEELRAAGEGYPVIVGDAEELNMLLETVPDHASPAIAATLVKAQELSWPQGLADLKQRTRAQYPEDEFDDAPEAELGRWPARPDVLQGPSAPYNILTGDPFDPCYILIVPARHSWEVPAYVGWGGWNENPPPELHIAALRSWHERFGAELVGMSFEVLDLRVARRPATRDEAMALAREHFDYCPDIVLQGTDTLAPLAASNMVSDWWYFWWD